MKKQLKRMFAALLALTMVFALAACGGSGGSGSSGGSSSGGASAASFKKCKIGVALYSDTGPSPESTKAFLAGLTDSLNVSFEYALLSSTDEATNLTKIQELISAGCNGIICTMDMGIPAILDECQAAGVKLAGYLCDYDTSYTNNYDAVFKNPTFLGTVSDGPSMINIVGGQTFFDSLIAYNEAHPDAPLLHVSMCTFPVFAYPVHRMYAEQFVSLVEEYNKTAAQPITVDPLNDETDVLMFRPMDSTYFSKHPGIDAVMSFCAGAQFVYPTMVSAGVDKTIKLFNAGYDGSEGPNFGSNGTQTYQQLIVCAPESIVVPLVLLINDINGVQFSDMPAEAQRIAASQLIVRSDEDMATFQKHIYNTFKFEDAFLTAEDVVNLTAVANPNATYADLIAVVDHMTIADIK